MVVRALAVMLVVLSLGTVRADPSERTDRDRIWHVAPFAAGGAFYLVLEFGLKEAVTPDHCRWCRSNRFDNALRTSLKWADVERADMLSNLTGYAGAPVYAIGMLLASSAGDLGIDRRRWYDDTIPILQAGIVTGVLNQATKLVFVRRRPFAEFKGTSVQGHHDVNTSFFSGHTALAFAMSASAGTVAHLRGYRSEAAIWIGGGLLAVTTGYLRIASDAHYATDVIAGALIGSAIGISIPLLFHKDVLTDEAPVARTRRGDTFMVSLGSWRF